MQTSLLVPCVHALTNSVRGEWITLGCWYPSPSNTRFPVHHRKQIPSTETPFLPLYLAVIGVPPEVCCISSLSLGLGSSGKKKKKKRQFYSCIRQMLTTVTPTEGATKKWEYSPQPTTNLVYNKVSQIFTLLFFFFPGSALGAR